MTTIPDEIMQQAIATARAYNRDWENGVDIIAAALLAERLAAEKRGREEERERCTRIADNYAAAHTIGGAIGAAVRSGS